MMEIVVIEYGSRGAPAGAGRVLGSLDEAILGS
jgi:hypothetical protein